MINKIFRVGHVDPLCMFNKLYSELVMWTLYACLIKISRVGHVDPLCMFNENIKSLIMWTLYPCFMEDIRSRSCGPSLHP